MEARQAMKSIYEQVLYGKDRELSNALLHELIEKSVHNTLNPELQEVLDEYVQAVEEV